MTDFEANGLLLNSRLTRAQFRHTARRQGVLWPTILATLAACSLISCGPEAPPTLVPSNPTPVPACTPGSECAELSKICKGTGKGTAECPTPDQICKAAGGSAACPSADQVCKDAGGLASCAPADRICKDKGGTADCSVSCQWHTVGGNRAIAEGPAVCYSRSQIDTAFRLVDRRPEHDNDANCCSGPGPCDVHQSYSGTVSQLEASRGYPVIRLTVPSGRVACVQAGRQADVSCTPGCLP